MRKPDLTMFRPARAAALLLTAPLLMAPLLIATTAFAQPAAAAGDELYANNCAACHQPKGEGIAGPFPALAGNAMVNGPGETLITTLLMGRGGMPAFRNELSDDDLSALLTFIRGAWGNSGGRIAAADVAAARAKAALGAQAKDLQAH